MLLFCIYVLFDCGRKCEINAIVIVIVIVRQENILLTVIVMSTKLTVSTFLFVGHLKIYSVTKCVESKRNVSMCDLTKSPKSPL